MITDQAGPEDILTLPDHLREGLDLLFVGLNPSQYSAEVGHYFANPRNRFWPAFNRSGLVGRQVTAECSTRRSAYPQRDTSEQRGCENN